MRHGDGPLFSAYRPLRFSEVLGNDDAVEKLAGLAHERAPRAFLIHGPAGSGKTTLARVYGRSYVCSGERPDGYEPCGLCDACKETETRSSHPMWGRMHEVAAAASGDPVEAADAVIERFRMPFDVIVVNEADRLLIQMQRLLHILEEGLDRPLIFCTTRLDKFDGQFRSRCVLVETHPVGRGDVLPYLRSIAQVEGADVPDDDIEKLLDGLPAPAQGQMRDVLVAFDALLARIRGQKTPAGDRR